MRETLQDPTTLKAIDMDKSLDLVGDIDLAKEMLSLFNEKLPKEIAAITTAYEAGDHRELREAAHKLVGGSAYCGVDALRAATRALEYAAEDGNSTAIDACYQSFHTQLARFDAEFTALVATA